LLGGARPPSPLRSAAGGAFVRNRQIDGGPGRFPPHGSGGGVRPASDFLPSTFSCSLFHPTRARCAPFSLGLSRPQRHGAGPAARVGAVAGGRGQPKVGLWGVTGAKGRPFGCYGAKGRPFGCYGVSELFEEVPPASRAPRARSGNGNTK